ncbi:MAG: hypothetical protein PHI02_07055 [Sulfurovaceae bacterium]|nr:hypothetical protein [Sulfurovaceae bacterium]
MSDIRDIVTPYMLWIKIALVGIVFLTIGGTLWYIDHLKSTIKVQEAKYSELIVRHNDLVDKTKQQNNAILLLKKQSDADEKQFEKEKEKIQTNANKEIAQALKLKPNEECASIIRDIEELSKGEDNEKNITDNN